MTIYNNSFGISKDSTGEYYISNRSDEWCEEHYPEEQVHKLRCSIDVAGDSLEHIIPAMILTVRGEPEAVTETATFVIRERTIRIKVGDMGKLDRLKVSAPRGMDKQHAINMGYHQGFIWAVIVGNTRPKREKIINSSLSGRHSKRGKDNNLKIVHATAIGDDSFASTSLKYTGNDIRNYSDTELKYPVDGIHGHTIEGDERNRKTLLSERLKELGDVPTSPLMASIDISGDTFIPTDVLKELVEDMVHHKTVPMKKYVRRSPRNSAPKAVSLGMTHTTHRPSKPEPLLTELSNFVKLFISGNMAVSLSGRKEAMDRAWGQQYIKDEIFKNTGESLGQYITRKSGGSSTTGGNHGE